MQLEFYDSLGKPQCHQASRVVIKSSAGAILAAVVEYQPDVYYITHHEDPNFERVLQTMGVLKTVLVTQEIKAPTLEDFKLDFSRDINTAVP